MTERESFAETLARLRAQPSRPERVPTGRRGDRWGDPAGLGYDLVDDDVTPARAVELATTGAQVVFDACGCGGTECQLDWLSSADVNDLVASGTAPRRGRGRADLEHWRSADGSDLLVLAVDVIWGERIG